MQKGTLFAGVVVCGVVLALAGGNATAAPPAAVGACTDYGQTEPGSGGCAVVSELICIVINGTYHGDGTTCPVEPPEPKLETEGSLDPEAPVDAPPAPVGACTDYGQTEPGSGGCAVVSELICIVINGTYHGDGTTCPVEPDPKLDAQASPADVE